ncbi:MAG: hypothetical protein MJE63_14345 [Proteobacteria bacterium]|nr:hypothetical protein [Pseudomonadota bacterium]
MPFQLGQSNKAGVKKITENDITKNDEDKENNSKRNNDLTDPFVYRIANLDDFLKKEHVLVEWIKDAG